jgi:hypothetical protein
MAGELGREELPATIDGATANALLQMSQLVEQQRKT